MIGVGGELRKERESRNIMLQDIARSTKIGIRYLEALEDDRLDRIPGTFFVKGIIRTYARTLGLDEDTILEKYREAGLLKNVEEESDQPHTYQLPGRQRLVYSIAAAIALVALSVFLYFSMKSGTSPERLEAVDFAYPPSAEEHFLPAPDPIVIEEEPPEETGLVFEASFNQETWLQVYADGLMEINGIRGPGDRSQVRAERELLIHLGNAGGFDFTLNGRSGRSFGRSGAVVRNILITPDNMGDFLADPEPEKDGSPGLRP